MSAYTEFQYFLGQYVSSDGLPDRIEDWDAAGLKKLAAMIEAELARRADNSRAES